MLQNSLFKKLSVLGAAFSLAASLVFFAMGQWLFGFGIWVSAAWIFLNSYFLFRLMQIGFEPKLKTNDQILLFSILKFPVLYVAGFFILKTRVFPIYSILMGLSLFILAFIVTWIRVNVVSIRPGSKRQVSS